MYQCRVFSAAGSKQSGRKRRKNKRGTPTTTASHQLFQRLAVLIIIVINSSLTSNKNTTTNKTITTTKQLQTTTINEQIYKMTSYSQPQVPALYFENHHHNNNEQQQKNNSSDHHQQHELPSELLSCVLTAYANWGDLAKLACVQKSWSSIVMDTANQSQESKWELAQALMNGHCGLEKNPSQGSSNFKRIGIQCSHR